VAGFSAPLLAIFIDASSSYRNSETIWLMLSSNIINDAAIFLYLLIIGVFLLGKYFSRKGDVVVWRTMQAQIDMLQKVVFADFANDLNDNHRVTLFRYKKWSWSRFKTLTGLVESIKKGSWPGSGWLVPVIRSGHTGKDTNVIFWAPDSGGKAEGVAGRSWSSDHSVDYSDLPNITKNSNKENKDKYCQRCNMERWILDDYCEKGRSLARHILAYPVRTRSGERWGVLVFDSMSENGVDAKSAQDAFEKVIDPIGILLEGV